MCRFVDFHYLLDYSEKETRKALQSHLVWGWGKPRISLSSALGSWFQDTARGLLIFKSRNLVQRQHLNSKITGFATRLNSSIRGSVSKCRRGEECDSSTSARPVWDSPAVPAAISPGSSSAQLRDTHPRWDHTQAAENIWDKQFLLLERQHFTQQHRICTWGWLRGFFFWFFVSRAWGRKGLHFFFCLS